MTMKFRGNIWMAHRLLQPMSMQRLHMFTYNVAPAARCIGPTDWIFFGSLDWILLRIVYAWLMNLLGSWCDYFYFCIFCGLDHPCALHGYLHVTKTSTTFDHETDWQSHSKQSGSEIVSCLDTKILDIGWILLKTSFVNFRRMQIAAV